MGKSNDDSVIESNIATKTNFFALLFIMLGLVLSVVAYKLEPNREYSGTIIQPKDDSNESFELKEVPHDNEGKTIVAEVLKHISIILITACVIELVAKVQYSKAFNKQIQALLENNVPLYKGYYKHNVLGVSDSLPDITPLIASAKEEITIVQTYIPNLDGYTLTLFNALKRNPNLKVKVYLLDPESKIAEFRSTLIQTNQSEDEIDLNVVKNQVDYNRKILKDLIKKLESHCPGFKPNVTLSTFSYELLPLASIYRFDDEMYVGFFRYGNEAVHSAQLKLDYNKGIGLQFKEHLEYLVTHPSVKQL